MPKITDREIAELRKVYQDMLDAQHPDTGDLMLPSCTIATLDRLAELEAAMSPQPSRAQIAREFLNDIRNAAFAKVEKGGVPRMDLDDVKDVLQQWEAEEPTPCHHIIGIVARGNGAAIPVYDAENNERIDFRFTHCPSCGARLVTPDTKNNE